MKLVYLAAMHNSGSTVIAMVANAHPDMVSPGEMVGPGGRFHGANGPDCSCGAAVAKCPHWLEVRRRYAAQGHPWTPGEWGLEYRFEGHPWLSRLAFAHPGPRGARDRVLEAVPILGAALRNLHERNRCFARAILDTSGKKVLLDASKHPERIVHLSRINDLDPYVVHLIRDPRGWCNSRKKNHNEPVEQTAARWVSRNRYIERLAERLPANRRMRVLYEDFCRDPQGVMDRIGRLVSLPSAPIPDDLRSISHHLLGNRMRNRKDAKIVQDESWRENLDENEIKTVERVTGPAAGRYGYKF